VTTTKPFPLDDDACHRALLARDARFDGLFFVAVSTTGIYCRPICPARTPRKDRCSYFRLPAEAERAGFRACLRCRPELAPGSAPTEARSRLVASALDRIERGALEQGGVEALSSALGVTSRHLRRTVEAELGVTPTELEETRRLALGKQLLHDTSLPLARVAFASGFGSIRRFNAVFARRFGRPPSSVRRSVRAREASEDGMLSLRLDRRPPFAWAPLLAFLSRRAVPGVERVDGDTYERTVAMEDVSGWLRARERNGQLALSVSPSLVPHLARVVRGVRDLFDLDARPAAIAEVLGTDRTLAPIVRRVPGLRVPGAFDPFEVAIRSVLAQQISVQGATTLSGRITEAFGRVVPGLPVGLDRVSPSASELARASVAEIRAIGMPESRARTLSLLSRAIDGGTIDLGARSDASTTIALLRTIPGIGPFTAHVIAMRVLRDPDAFPENDLFVMRRLGPKAVSRAERWRPFRAYAVMHLWEDEGAKR
jgi:AraC family transcriptional regulator of adaptative response / DNA-3-methyladenine glycosylase II